MSNIIDDAIKNIAMREAVYHEQMDEAARRTPDVSEGMWSRRALLPLIIPEAMPDDFEPYASIVAHGMIVCVALGQLPPEAAFASTYAEGVMLGREIERLSQTGKYPVKLPEET